MRRAVHPKFGSGVVVEEHQRDTETFFVVDFPGVGRKKLAARFVEIEIDIQIEETKDRELAARDLRSADHEAALADRDAYRAYGRWLVEHGEDHGELILLECDPPSGPAPRAEREAHARDVKRLTRKVLAPLHRVLAETNVEYTLKHGFISHANVLVAPAAQLVAIVRALRHARVAAMLEGLTLPPPIDGGDLSPLWNAWSAQEPFRRLEALSVPSPGARGEALGSLFAPLKTLVVKQGGELRLPALPRISVLRIEEPSPGSVIDIAEGAPSVRASCTPPTSPRRSAPTLRALRDRSRSSSWRARCTSSRPTAQRLVALVVQGKVPSDEAIAGALDLSPEAAEALLDEVEKKVRTATRA